MQQYLRSTSIVMAPSLPHAAKFCDSQRQEMSHLKKARHEAVPDVLDNILIYTAVAHVLCGGCKDLRDAPDAGMPLVILQCPSEAL